VGISIGQAISLVYVWTMRLYLLLSLANNFVSSLITSEVVIYQVTIKTSPAALLRVSDAQNNICMFRIMMPVHARWIYIII